MRHCEMSSFFYLMPMDIWHINKQPVGIVVC